MKSYFIQINLWIIDPMESIMIWAKNAIFSNSLNLLNIELNEIEIIIENWSVILLNNNILYFRWNLNRKTRDINTLTAGLTI
jgi:hypothetical protein